MERNSNISAILNVVTVNKEQPSLEIDSHYDSIVSCASIVLVHI